MKSTASRGSPFAFNTLELTSFSIKQLSNAFIRSNVSNKNISSCFSSLSRLNLKNASLLCAGGVGGGGWWWAAWPEAGLPSLKLDFQDIALSSTLIV